MSLTALIAAEVLFGASSFYVGNKAVKGELEGGEAVSRIISNRKLNGEGYIYKGIEIATTGTLGYIASGGNFLVAGISAAIPPAAYVSGRIKGDWKQISDKYARLMGQ